MIHTYRFVRTNTPCGSIDVLDPIFSLFFGKDWLNNTKISSDDDKIIYDIECDTKLPLINAIRGSFEFNSISEFTYKRKSLYIRSDKPSRLSKAILRKLNGSTEEVKITPQELNHAMTKVNFDKSVSGYLETSTGYLLVHNDDVLRVRSLNNLLNISQTKLTFHPFEGFLVHNNGDFTLSKDAKLSAKFTEINKCMSMYEAMLGIRYLNEKINLKLKG